MFEFTGLSLILSSQNLRKEFGTIYYWDYLAPVLNKSFIHWNNCENKSDKTWKAKNCPSISRKNIQGHRVIKMASCRVKDY